MNEDREEKIRDLWNDGKSGGVKTPPCFLLPARCRIAGRFPPLRLPAADTSPTSGGFYSTARQSARQRLPFRGCGVERRLRRIQRDEAGAAVAECKRRSKARSMMRQPQPGKAAQRPEGSSSPAVRHLPGSSRGGVKTPPYKPTQTAYFYDTRFGRL